MYRLKNKKLALLKIGIKQKATRTRPRGLKPDPQDIGPKFTPEPIAESLPAVCCGYPTETFLSKSLLYFSKY
jgi:hypothetical protein